MANNQLSGSGPNPVDQSGLCLLSLDGGGVRGLSTLGILRHIMTQLKRKPCEVFDLIGGTSTGGVADVRRLIAIMLGRLEMDVDECITAYNELMKTVFEQKLHRFPSSATGKIQAQFDSMKLRDAIDEVIIRKGFSPEDPFNDGQPRGCRVVSFVCATSKERGGITRLRSYDLPEKPNISVTIREAALATSAATGFFDPVTIGARHFVDGALGANNPINEVEGEASDIWCSETGELKPLVKCIISIGTGNPGKRAVEDRLLRFLTKTLVAMTTETEETEKKFIGRWRGHFDQGRYYRFNVEHGLQDIGLAEYKEQGSIEQATFDYLDHQDRVFRVRDCIENLKEKKNWAGHDLPTVVENPHFVGRNELLEELIEKLFSSHSGQIIALFGLGGVGKTQVALQLAYWVKENRPDHSVFWVSALSYAAFEQSYAGIMKNVGLQWNGTEDPKATVQHYLSSKHTGKWFLVVDNADDQDLLFKSSEHQRSINDYLPSSNSGRILFTTRTTKVANSVAGGDSIRLLEMTGKEAKGFLSSSLLQKDQLKNEAIINDLLQELTYLPLAIKQASAYINENGIGIAEYLRLFRHQDQRNRAELISSDFHDKTRYNQKNAISITWQISFDQILKTDATAVELLEFITCIEPKAIPRSLLPIRGSEQQLSRAIGTLCGYSFLINRDDEVYDMHSLVHAATELWIMKRDAIQETRKSAIQHLASVFPSNDWNNREIWRQYLPHTLKALQKGKEVNINASLKLHYQIGSCLREDGRIREAIAQLEHVVAIRETTLAEDHPSRLTSQHHLAYAYQANGQVYDAIKLLKHIVAIRETTLAEDHPARLASQHQLACAYQANGQVYDAIKLLKHVVAIRETTLAEDHPSRLASQHQLAYAYQANGQVYDAIKLLKHVVAIRETTLAEDHPARLASQHQLAYAYQANGQVYDAIKLLKHVVAIRETTLAEDHPSRLASQHQLAYAYQANGQVYDAIKLLKHVVAIRETTLAEDHPSRLASQHQLACAYQANGQVYDAIKLLKHVVAIRETTLAEDHPDRLASQHQLACAYQANGQVHDVIKLLKHVVAIRETTLAEDHPDRLASQHQLACAYQANGQVHDVIKLLKHVVVIEENILADLLEHVVAICENTPTLHRNTILCAPMKPTARFAIQSSCSQGFLARPRYDSPAAS
ncbi:hypothetical protein jhhlp_000330 [Lomentospora prolificans]|uniref:PNPLA domain-containing protein n=1 Tax=Lomentospora prolificans TaxID=41688 RepID=A0A2N3NKP2_9PEZI|nr:hypothetical protein jhhlp_000330 [Lomentospora prolificans]